jgi:hypothetical protein
LQTTLARARIARTIHTYTGKSKVSYGTISLGEPLIGFIAKDGKVLNAKLIGVDTSTIYRIIVLYEEDNQMQVSDDFCFFTARFAAEFAAAE